MAKPFIVGLAGTELTDNERAFLKENIPWGIILFKRNCDRPDQLRVLTDAIRDVYGTAEVPILIDQEGGRVQRLKSDHWRTYPAAASFYETYHHAPEKSLEYVRLNASLQASELKKMGVTVNCAPMIDVRAPGAHDIIGDRAFSEDENEVAAYGQAVIQGHIDQGILPVIKHIPGHGRAKCDSHEDLPVVESDLQTLQKDFKPFQILKDAPLAMTAHILYSVLDHKNCATLSSEVIKHVIRGMIGFNGLLMSDDISMKALKDDIKSLTRNILAAGCDLVLHCNGHFDEMVQISDVIEAESDMLDFRTNQMWNKLFMQASPRADDDLMQEYAELSSEMLGLRVKQMAANQ
ncbi:MAG: beta-N-acetylhexosaminidase [Pseudomonadota bacterium]